MSGRVMAENYLGSWVSLDAYALSADWDATVGGDSDGRTEAPDKGPPGTDGYRPQNGTFLLQGEIPGVGGFHLEFAVDLMVVAVKPKVLDLRISLVDVGDSFAGKEGWQTLLPKEVTAFDFPFGLRGWGVTEADAVEAKGLAQLG